MGKMDGEFEKLNPYPLLSMALAAYPRRCAVRREDGDREVIAGTDSAHCPSSFCKIFRFLEKRKRLVVKRRMLGVFSDLRLEEREGSLSYFRAEREN